MTRGIDLGKQKLGRQKKPSNRRTKIAQPDLKPTQVNLGQKLDNVRLDPKKRKPVVGVKKKTTKKKGKASK